ncbi:MULTISPECIES: GNAT family N-acetyltransferase [Rhizobium]|uniref:L-amino acid N-acyltransferase YncA n=1 Tax=Rhizobium binae TaxID=1138190 RepID=A0ABV2MQD2_9HYPH|nr:MULTISPECIES: GNAT family N-acetyltransferase [Rhizobium]NKL52697.1 GNAT family N-acetyltransferase [Rhizobium leguminosarum bv. viciae]MBX4911924.1 GNAT family N-acetyltransferase [Rhizobium bangladeshense]MBX4938004.1 GNAT family N-acetyltransferase [Rhizobium binae]MBX4944368.1 GNAT family N-acetyltransferase [Rhizobium binae]MBX4980466.1 GNAT family N-acetyltransferase [Rhizobium binae]
MDSLIIRQPRSSDKEDIVAVYESRGFFDYSPSRPDLKVIVATVDAYFTELVSDPASIILYVAELEYRLAGFAIARKGARATWEVQSGVHFDHRKQGIGHVLLAALFEEMYKRGPAACKATVHAGNVASIKMVSRFFREHGEFTGLPGFLQFTTSW